MSEKHDAEENLSRPTKGEALNRFLANTVTGVTINNHLGRLGELHRKISAIYFLHVSAIPTVSGGSGEALEQLTLEEGYGSYLRENGIDDIDLLQLEGLSRSEEGALPIAEMLTSSLAERIENLNRLAAGFMERAELCVGQVIKAPDEFIDAGEAGGQAESPWIVFSVLANGNILIVKSLDDETKAPRVVSMEEIIEWNPPAADSATKRLGAASTRRFSWLRGNRKKS